MPARRIAALLVALALIVYFLATAPTPLLASVAAAVMTHVVLQAMREPKDRDPRP